MGSHDISRINTHIEFQYAKEYSEHNRFILKISLLYFKTQSFRHTALYSLVEKKTDEHFFLEVIILFLPCN